MGTQCRDKQCATHDNCLSDLRAFVVSDLERNMKYLEGGQFFGETNTTIRLDGITLTDTEYTVERVDWHYHENPYFTFILDGLIVEGNRKKTHTCPAGTLLFHNWQEPHYDIKPEGFTRGFQIETEGRWFERFGLALSDLPAFTNIDDPQIKILFHRIFRETKLFSDGSEMAIEALLLDSLTCLAGHAPIAVHGRPKWVKRADEIIREGFVEGLTLTRLSVDLGLHPVYLSRAFPRYFRCSFGDYLRKIKVERSLRLLRRKNVSLTDISSACGFSDQSHFIRCFKASMGVSPRAYRKLVLQG